MKLITAGSLHSNLFVLDWFILLVFVLVILIVKVMRGADIRWPLATPDLRRVLWICAATYAGVTTLIPKIFWEDFNLDGIEAFEFGRSLNVHLLPHWEIFDNVFGTYLNFFLFAYPNHWFFSLFGPFEATARLPYFLYLVVAFAALILLIEMGKSSRPGWKEETGLWFALVVFTIVQAFSTNYEPFFADLAETAAPDLLQVVCFLSACFMLFSGRFRWFRIFAFMVFSAGPGGLLLLGTLGVALLFSTLPEKHQHWKEVCIVFLACCLFTVLYEILYIHSFLGGVNDQFSMRNMLRRLYPPTFTEFFRWDALLIPSGFLPALSLMAVRKRDQPEWVLAVVTVLYFGIVYIQAWSALHQFTAVMILPLIVFWRLFLSSTRAMQRWMFPAVLVSALICFFLSFPRHFKINQATRDFAAATSYEVGDYDGSYETALKAGRSLYALLPEDYRLHYPNQPWGTDHRVWIFYATRQKNSGVVLNYIVRPASQPSPIGFRMIQSVDGVAVYVRDVNLWKQHRERKLPQIVASPVYEPILAHTYQFFRDHIAKTKKR